MSEGKVIENSKSINTIESITKDLKNLGINDGDLLLVHSSLSSIGWVCGGAQAVISGLLKSIGKSGTLVMPAHSGDWSDPAKWMYPPVPKEWVGIIYDHMPPYNRLITPTRGMGKVAELFRTFPNTLRSNHPQVSFTANGSLAKEIVENHVLTPAFGINSPLGEFYKRNGKVLLLGVGFDSCTSFHLAEALIKKEPITRQGSAIIENNIRVWKWFEDYEYNSDDFEKIGEEFIKTNSVKIGNIGNAKSYLFDMKTGVDFSIDWLNRHRYSK